MSSNLSDLLRSVRAVQQGVGVSEFGGREKSFEETLAEVQAERREISSKRGIGGAFRKLAIVAGMCAAIGGGVSFVNAYNSASHQINQPNAYSANFSNPDYNNPDYVNEADNYFGHDASKYIDVEGNYDSNQFAKTITDKQNPANHIVLSNLDKTTDTVKVSPSVALRFDLPAGKKFAAEAIAVAAKDGRRAIFSRQAIKDYDLQVVRGPDGKAITITEGMAQEMKAHGIKLPKVSTAENSGNVIPDDMPNATRIGLERLKHLKALGLSGYNISVNGNKMEFNDPRMTNDHVEHEKHSHLPSHDTFNIGMGPQ